MNKSRICIINTGGTMGMRQGPHGFEPMPGLLSTQLSQIAELRDPTMPDYEVLEKDPLLDSSNMTPFDWQRIADDIAGVYDEYDGFVIVHGTDTMAYTTSALSFMLRGLQKSIIFTGSQIPLGLRRNDARENIITALILASEYRIPDIGLYFGGRLFRGCRATKLSNSSFNAFESPNYPPLGIVGTDINVFHDRFFRSKSDAFQSLPLQAQRVATFRLFPGVSATVLKNLLKQPLQALILEAYGAGNGPTDREFCDVLTQATDRGVIIVNCSQCSHGCVAMDDYATGQGLADAGVISGRDMTVEAAVTKLMFLLSQDLSPEEIRRQIPSNLAGELVAD